jgi:hypothetical protein
MELRRLAWRACLVAVISISGAAPTQADEASEPPAGEGAFCMLAIFSIANQVGLACHPGEEAEFQAALQSAVDRLGDYAVRNGGGTRSDLARFLREQGGEGRPKAMLCAGDATSIYEAFRKGGARAVRQATDKMVSRPGKPTWGTCL